MKRKRLKRTLLLNKTSIACLNNLEMGTAAGGCTTETLRETDSTKMEDACWVYLYPLKATNTNFFTFSE
ncbi:MAG: hypothetical protein GY757_34070 [bacterium]|nr:hypothetical protein [bacterium]